jgi:diguanylate cyclase (GGDEF)-like protein/PAS domain S-box-containing protein
MLGGFLNGSGVVLWSFVSALGSLVFDRPSRAWLWFGGFVGVLALAVALQPLIPPVPALPRWAITAFFAMNVGGVATVSFSLFWYFMHQRETIALQTRDLAEDLARQQTQRRFETMAQNSSDVISLLDSDFAITYQSRSLSRDFGYMDQSLQGQSWLSWVHPDEQAQALVVLSQAKGSPQATLSLECRLRRADGTYCYTETLITNLLDDQHVERIVLTTRDITDRKRAAEQLLRMALYDALTGLPNRRLLNDRLSQALSAAQREGQELAVLVLDIDSFKDVNDKFGHQAGDVLLQQFAARVDAQLRSSDTLGRLSGDEFVALLRNCFGVDEASAVAERIRGSLEVPFVVDDNTVEITCSIGIAVYPRHGSDEEDLLRRADSAMYVAKRDRLGHLTCDEVPEGRGAGILALRREIRQALEREELRLFYQPKLELRTSQCRGAEALIRWNHPERGLVGAGQFLPQVERTNLMQALTHWVLRSSIRQGKLWRDRGLDLCVSVNLSMLDLHDRSLASMVQDLLAQWRLPPSNLKVEVTETGLMAHPQRALAVIRELAEVGVGLSIDDFGTGYSSFAYLKDLPVQELKIDQSFVRGLADLGSRTIVRSIIELGHNLGISVVAEGVEEAAALEALRELGCDLAQGYYVAPPLPPDAFHSWLADPAINPGRSRANQTA